MSFRSGLAALVIPVLALAGACGGGGDPEAADAGPPGDEDAQPATDARTDAAPLTEYECDALDMPEQNVCAMVPTGRVTACSIDPETGDPSQTGWLEIERPDGERGYLCATKWEAGVGFYFSLDRLTMLSASSACCDGPEAAPLDGQAADPHFGAPHGPTIIKPHELAEPTGGEVRQNPFSVIVSNPESAAAFRAQLAIWKSYAGDGQPHPAPDGTGSYWFPAHIDVNYVVIPTANGPIIVLAPEPSMDAQLTTPLGHPTMGACKAGGGVPLAFIAGDLRDTTLTNGSGRYGYESTVTPKALENTAKLFNCYGIEVTDVEYSPPTP